MTKKHKPCFNKKDNVCLNDDLSVFHGDLDDGVERDVDVGNIVERTDGQIGNDATDHSLTTSVKKVVDFNFVSHLSRYQTPSSIVLNHYSVRGTLLFQNRPYGCLENVQIIDLYR